MGNDTIVILHLSDIHFAVSNNPIDARVSKIVAAVRAEAPQVTTCIVAVTGDIAFSGRPDEYAAAEAFLRAVKLALETDHEGCLVHFILVPGNHDCDLGGDLELRQMAIEGMAPRLDTLDPSGQIATTCLAVQNDFFDFHARLCMAVVNSSDRIYYEREIAIGAHTLRFQCHNSAWISQNPEKPGLLYPTSVASAKDSPSRAVAVAISLIHHPFAWYVPSNSRALQEFLERTSDMVLTGHDHIAGTYARHSHTGARVDYIEGGVLQSSADAPESEFHLILLNLEERKYSYTTHKWNGEIYSRSSRHEPTAFHRNPLLAQHAFDNNDDFLRFLQDPGTAFTHPRRRDLFLADLFICPDLSRRTWTASQREDPVKTRIPSRSVLDFVSDKGNVVITGAANAGKTSLLKTLYLDLKRRKGVVPLMLNGSDIRGMRPSGFRKVCSDAFERQYPSRQLERYEQLERAHRLLLVDDFDEARLTEKGLRVFIDAAKSFAGSVIIMADELFTIELLTHSGESARDAFETFELCTIREFGYALQGQLITKWHSLGYEVTAPPDLDRIIEDCERVINTLIVKSLVPSNPLTLLTLLQTMEAATTPSLASGSYGYLYEALITASLSHATNKAATLDTKYTYLSIVAYAMYEKDVERISRQDIEDLTDSYFETFRMKFNIDQMLKELEQGRIIEQSHGFVYFKYKYIYCYFVARYLNSRNSGITAESTAEALRQMADRIHYEDHANILIFYVYLSRDPALIAYLISCAKRIYADHSPCNLDSDVAFVNALYTDTKPLMLPSGDAADHREEERERLDAAAGEEGLTQASMKTVVYADDLEDLLKVNFAFKTLNVLGHVLRNFHGSLEGDVKRDIAMECYGLGLRTLRAVLRIAEVNLEELRTYFARLIREHRSITGVTELAHSTDGALIWLTLGCTFGIIKRISTAVGLQELSGTYADVLQELGPAIPGKLIDLCIRLDHFRAIPLDDIESMASDLRSNHFTRRVLRDLVANHMYLNKVDYRSRQRLGALLDIRSTDVRFLENPDKRTR